MDRSIFRAYDIRGIFEKDINVDDAGLVARAIFEYIKPTKVAVGYDARLAAPAIHERVCRVLMGCGVEVTSLGMVSSDMASFAAGALGFDLSIMITASHNPKEWIGMKLTKQGGVAVGGGGEIQEIGELVQRVEESSVVISDAPIQTRDILEEWVGHVLTFVDVTKVPPLKIVADAGNGVAGPMVEAIAKHLPIEIIPMYFEPDGNFPNHLPSPIEPENTKDLRARVVEEGADLGLAFDGDADRVFLVDEKGRLVTGSEMTAMLIDALLSKDSTKIVLYNAICGWNVRDVLAKYPGVISHRTKVGHGYIKKDMVAYGADFAGEHSGHYFFKANFNADSGLVASMVVLGLIAERGQKLSEILVEHRKYFDIPETNFEVSDAKAVMEALAEHYKDGQVDWLDGLTVSSSDWWMNVRPSSNEPLLRLNLEAKTPEILEERSGELTELIKQLGQSAS